MTDREVLEPSTDTKDLFSGGRLIEPTSRLEELYREFKDRRTTAIIP